jgi:hypothetical protein
MVSTWQNVCEKLDDREAKALDSADKYTYYKLSTLHMPSDAELVWKALRYGSLHGAPVTPKLEGLFREKRGRLRTVLHCFKAAGRLSDASDIDTPGCHEQRRIWAGMAALPPALVEEILIFADLEIPETVMRRPALHAPAT